MILAVLAFLGIIAASIMLIIAFIRKKPKRISLIAIAACFVLFIVGVLITPTASEPALSDVQGEENGEQNIEDPIEAERPSEPAAGSEQSAVVDVDSMSEYVKAIAEETGAEVTGIVSEQNEDDTYAVYVTIKGRDSLSNKLIRDGMLISAQDIMQGLQESEDIAYLSLMYTFPLVDAYGNKSEEPVMTIEVSKETLNKINFDNFNFNNFEKVADRYFLHSALLD